MKNILWAVVNIKSEILIATPTRKEARKWEHFLFTGERLKIIKLLYDKRNKIQKLG